jgi:hypothetical protein
LGRPPCEDTSIEKTSSEKTSSENTSAEKTPSQKTPSQKISIAAVGEAALRLLRPRTRATAGPAVAVEALRLHASEGAPAASRDFTAFSLRPPRFVG